MSERIGDYLARGQTYVGTVSGSSMLPLVRPHRDIVVIEPVTRDFRLYDVILHEWGGSHVLHRCVRKDGRTCTTLGDNCITPEEGVPCSEVLGVMTALHREKRCVNMDGLVMRGYARVWSALFPMRKAAMRVRMRIAKRAKSHARR